MSEYKYIVWVGGVPVWSGYSLREAELVVKAWNDRDYTDVILEKDEFSPYNTVNS